MPEIEATARVLVVLGALLFLAPAPAAARQFPSDAELQALIDARVREGQVPGIVLGVLDADGTTRVFSAGTAGAGGRPLGERSLFEIGSITKVFTTTILADMVRRGEVQLSDPVAMYLPRGVRVPSRGDREITLLDLATHTSGLPREADNMAPADPSNPYADYTVEHLYAFLDGHTLRRDPGAEAEYSNLGMGLLGHALSLAAGKDYEALLRERVLEPLGMENTGARLDGDRRRWMTTGYDPRGRVTGPLELAALAAAGGLRSDVYDMLRFLHAQVGEPTRDLERAMRITHEPRAAMSERASVALGWLVRSVGESRIIWHGGTTLGFWTFVGFDPDRGVGVVVLTNSRQNIHDLGMHLINPEVPLREPPPALWRAAGSMLFRYNRVEGFSLGAQRRFDLGPASLQTQLRFGFADQAPRGEIALERWGGELQSRLGAYRRLEHATTGFGEPPTLASAGALLLGRDDLDYYDALGAELRLRPSISRAQWYDVRLYAERQRAVERGTQFSFARLADSERRFRDNFAADAADQLGVRALLRGSLGTGTLAPRVSAALSLGGETGDFRIFRPEVLLQAGTPLPFGLALGAEAAAGAVEGNAVPAQALWRLGGAPTLRGYPGSSLVGERYWRTRTELGRNLGELGLVLFSDAAGRPRGELASASTLVSVGIGARDPTGIIRMDLAYGLRAPGGWRLHLHLHEMLRSDLDEKFLSAVRARLGMPN